MKRDNLRLILGLGRSGTTWLASALGRSSTPMRFLMEGMFHHLPKIDVAPPPDHTAIPFVRQFGDDHPFLAFYDAICSRNYTPEDSNLHRHTVRNDEEYKIVLVKEVHGLLSSEALINNTGAKSVFIYRNPIYSIDSLLHRDGFRTIYLDNEEIFIKNDDFLLAYFQKTKASILATFSEIARIPDGRRRAILNKILTAAIISDLMRIIGQSHPQCISVRYEEMCMNPAQIVSMIAEFLDLNFSEDVELFLKKSSTEEQPDTEKYPVYRASQENIARPFKFLSHDEVQHSQDILVSIGLSHLFEPAKILRSPAET